MHRAFITGTVHASIKLCFNKTMREMSSPLSFISHYMSFSGRELRRTRNKNVQFPQISQEPEQTDGGLLPCPHVNSIILRAIWPHEHHIQIFSLLLEIINWYCLKMNFRSIKYSSRAQVSGSMATSRFRLTWPKVWCEAQWQRFPFLWSKNYLQWKMEEGEKANGPFWQLTLPLY